METNSAANRILCSERSYRLLRDQAPGIYTKRRGKIQVKGKGDMNVYWVGDDLLTPRFGLKDKTVEFDLPVGFDCSSSSISPDQATKAKAASGDSIAPTTSLDRSMLEQSDSTPCDLEMAVL